MSKNITHGYHLVKGKTNHPMEDYVFAEFKQVNGSALGLFTIFNGHLSHANLFNNILNEVIYNRLDLTVSFSYTLTVCCFPTFGLEPANVIRRAYRLTDTNILEQDIDLGKGGSAKVTAMLINCQTLVIANVGYSRAVISKNGVAKQLSVDHEPPSERESIENKGDLSRYCMPDLLGMMLKVTPAFPYIVFVSGDFARVGSQLAVARAFGDKSLKKHLTSEPDVSIETIDDDTDLIILASDGLWKVMSNQLSMLSKALRNKDARSAAKHLTEEAVKSNSKDDISIIVIKFE
ncbi:hypothetical protein CXB51_009638 [Gossypium anomalum]|uniref:PPM-type phosphatase domain-containing protein n=1 Tax=Gossypium anomalum TaxID=47600 RepID=A0A8J5Z1X1_9ROSI|nr:hypothetical protein CXB51_009638 [Gossypium anomalum]